MTLLEQFARESVKKTGIQDDSLVREAEVSEDLDALASDLLQDVTLGHHSNATTTAVNYCGIHDATGNTSISPNDVNSTVLPQASGVVLDVSDQSMVESTVANGIQREDRITHLSINGANHSETSSAFEWPQASPRLATYKRELGRMAARARVSVNRLRRALRALIYRT